MKNLEISHMINLILNMKENFALFFYNGESKIKFDKKVTNFLKEQIIENTVLVDI